MSSAQPKQTRYATPDQKRLLAAHGVPHVAGRTKTDAEALLQRLVAEGKIPASDAQSPRRTLPASSNQLAELVELGGDPTVAMTRGEADDQIVLLRDHGPATPQELLYLHRRGIDPPPGLTRLQFRQIRTDLEATGEFASEAQLDFIVNLGGTLVPGMSKAAAARLIDALTEHAPMSEGQRSVIEGNGGIIDCSLTYKQASGFIDRLLDDDELNEEIPASRWLQQSSGMGCLSMALVLPPVFFLLLQAT